MAENINWTAAIVFYLVYITGIFHFAIIPATRINSPKKALISGGIFGFYCYATFELTSLAVLQDWPIGIVPIDILWGIILTASVAWFGALINIRISD